MKSVKPLFLLLALPVTLLFALRTSPEETPASPLTISPDPCETEEEEEAVTDYLPIRLVLEDSVAVWDEANSDLRPIRPFHPDKDLLTPPEFPDVPHSPAEKPIPVSWKQLTNITYVLTYNKKLDMEVYAPVYTDTLRQLHGKFVSIRGYVIPYEEDQATVALSANPYASCFFCGKASPASVLTLRLGKRGKRYKLDARRTFKGHLKLNYDDPEEFYYILDQAKEL